MRVLLVHPGGVAGGIGLIWSRTIPIALPYLAALTPTDVQLDIRYLMHNKLDDDYGVEYDLVGVSAITTYAKRAYEIADRFRKLGRRVVMGGLHPSVFPERSSKYCDSIVIGEAENIWPKVIDDVRRGTLKPIYTSNGFPDLKGVSRPRYELLDLGSVADSASYPVLTSKGCPNSCDFCGVPEYFGRKIRTRRIEDVLSDIRYIADETRGKCVTFVDDNLIADRPYAKELLTKLIPFKITWGGECTLDIANDPELLDLAAASGCVELSVGMESINPKSLREVSKRCNVPEKYPYQIRQIRKKKITLVANIMFGFDHDTRKSLLETADVLIGWKVPFLSPFILRPIVGTRLFDRLQKEGRLLPEIYEDSTRTDIASFIPKKMTPEELEQAYWDTCTRFYSLPSIIMRCFVPVSRSDFRALALNLLVNLKAIQWPRVRRIPLLRKIFETLKSFARRH